jgi:hypothetical protein
MTDSKTQQISALALELLEDAEMSRTSVDAMVLKASRLARLTEDAEAMQWLSHERLGYNATDPISIKYLNSTARWIDVKNDKAYFAGIAVQEASAEGTHQQFEVLKKLVPSGNYALPQARDQQQRAATLTANLIAARKIISAVRAQVQEFATRIYYEHLFSQQAQTIFEQYKTLVDALLAATAQTAFTRLPQAFERLGAADDSEAISHALTTSRRVIDSFADAVFPARKEPFQLGQQPIDVGQQQTRNRVRAYIYTCIGQGSRYERLSRGLSSLYDRVSAGVHSDVDLGEARALVLQTYLLLGEILTLPPQRETHG